MHRFEVYKDSENLWRWTMKAGNNEIIADSSESYTRKDDAIKAAKRVDPHLVIDILPADES